MVFISFLLIDPNPATDYACSEADLVIVYESFRESSMPDFIQSEEGLNCRLKCFTIPNFPYYLSAWIYRFFAFNELILFLLLFTIASSNKEGGEKGEKNKRESWFIIFKICETVHFILSTGKQDNHGSIVY